MGEGRSGGPQQPLSPLRHQKLSPLRTSTGFADPDPSKRRCLESILRRLPGEEATAVLPALKGAAIASPRGQSCRVPTPSSPLQNSCTPGQDPSSEATLYTLDIGTTSTTASSLCPEPQSHSHSMCACILDTSIIVTASMPAPWIWRPQPPCTCQTWSYDHGTHDCTSDSSATMVVNMPSCQTQHREGSS